MSFAATDDAQAATPGSPPDLTGSKSSKSSSYHSSYHSEEDSILADINHFEDIGLDDEAVRSELEIGDFDLKSPTPYLSNFNASELRSAKRRMPPSLKKTHTAISHRELTGSGTRPAYPRLRSPIGGVVADTFPNGLAPGLLIPRGHNPRSPHGFPPHDHRSRSLSPNTLVHPHRLPSPTSRSSSAAGPSIPRRGSWQSQTRSRKTQADLEREFDEEDGDDVPDNYLLENVPISPRPPEERSQPPSPARSPDRHPHPHAPEKTKEKRVKTAGNGTPPHKVEHGDLKSPTNGGMPKPPIRGMSMGQFPIHRPGDEHRYQMKGRAKSWTVVLSELSAEARALTEKLEEHADETESFSQNNSARNSAGSTSSSSSAGSGGKPPQAHSRMNTRSASTPHLPSTIPLPPLTRPSHNVLLDPLPPSKEKSAVLSRTRPSWLPPKNPSEEKRHLKEYARMMAASLESERKRREQKEGRRRAYKAEEEERERRWEEDVLPNWKEGTMLDWHRDKGVRELWWRGIPARVRGRVWARAVGNELSLSEGSFRAALERGRVVERMLDSQEGGGKGMGLRNGEEKRRMEWIRCIRRDVAETFKELGLFQPGGRLERELRDVLVAYAMYRSDVGYVRGMNTIAALLLLTLSHSEPAHPAQTFILLANALNRPLPLAFHTHDSAAMGRYFSATLSALHLKLPSLHAHLCAIDPYFADRPASYLKGFLGSLGTGVPVQPAASHGIEPRSHGELGESGLGLSLDEISRLWDVWVFEGDGVLVRGCVAGFMAVEGKLYACRSKEDVLKVLGVHPSQTAKVTPSGTEEVREAGKDEEREEGWMRNVRDAGRYNPGPGQRTVSETVVVP